MNESEVCDACGKRPGEYQMEQLCEWLCTPCFDAWSEAESTAYNDQEKLRASGSRFAILGVLWGLATVWYAGTTGNTERGGWSEPGVIVLPVVMGIALVVHGFVVRKALLSAAKTILSLRGKLLAQTHDMDKGGKG